MKWDKWVWKHLAKLLKLKRLIKTVILKSFFVERFNLGAKAATKNGGGDLNPGFMNPSPIPVYYKHARAKSLQSCLTLCDPMVCSSPGLSVHGISQARILEWVAIFSSRGSSWPRDRTPVSCIAGRFLTAEPPGKPSINTLPLFLGKDSKLYVSWITYHFPSFLFHTLPPNSFKWLWITNYV